MEFARTQVALENARPCWKGTALLGQIPSMKQAQLKIAAGGNIEGTNWRAAIPVEAVGSHRKEVKIYLVILCWFLRCKGSVTAMAFSVGLQLQVKQLNPFALERLLGVLHDSRLDAWRLRRVGNCPTLVCTDLATSNTGWGWTRLWPQLALVKPAHPSKGQLREQNWHWRKIEKKTTGDY